MPHETHTVPKIVDPKITVGNIITAATIFVAGIAGWVSFANGIESNTRDISSINIRVDRIESNIGVLIQELNRERIDQTRILTELQTDVRYIKGAIDRN